MNGERAELNGERGGESIRNRRPRTDHVVHVSKTFECLFAIRFVPSRRVRRKVKAFAVKSESKGPVEEALSGICCQSDDAIVGEIGQRVVAFRTHS